MKSFRSRLFNRIIRILGLLLVIVVALVISPLLFFGTRYLAGHIRASSVKITLTPEVSPARLDTSGDLITVGNAGPVTPIQMIELVPVAEGLSRPVYVTHAFDERLFVLEKEGIIRIVQNNELLADVFLDIRDQVLAEGSEQGLLGLAFHPNYQENGRFYVHYTNKEGHTVIARYQVQPGQPNEADPSSAASLLMIGQPFNIHNGGQMQFGPDGYLYIGVGDGGPLNDFYKRGQDQDDLLGSILRIDVDYGEPYAVPADNPYVDDPAGRDEIWATGLRNPWRFSFDRLTHDLYIGDVGQDRWEEINFQPAGSLGGENYGWSEVEGNECFPPHQTTCDQSGFIPPIHTYAQPGGCAVIGGYVYRGSQFPTLNGHYFFADYCMGIISALSRLENGEWQAVQVYDAPFPISSFGEDVNGELYVLNFQAGSVLQLQP